MAEFNPDEYLKKYGSDNTNDGFNPDEYLKKYSLQEDKPIEKVPEQYEAPGLARRLYEQNVVIPVRAARHLAPFPETIQENIIDPIAGAFSGESAAEHKAKREEYDRYLRQVYPTATEAYESRGQLAGGLIKGSIPYLRAIEPIAEQTITRPESMGLNPETVLNTANLGISAALSAPKAAAESLAFIKARPDQRQSLKEYMTNPRGYDVYEASKGGQPVKALETEVQTNLANREAQRSQNIAERTQAYNDLKSEDTYQVRKAIEDVETQTSLGTGDGDAMIKAVKDLQDSYKKTAEVRNKVLESVNGEIGIDQLQPLYQNAYKTVYSDVDRRAIENAWKELAATAKKSPYSDKMVVSPREVDRLRQIYQSQVDYGKFAHNHPYQNKLNVIAGQLNDIMDASIPGNHELRSQIRGETIRFNKAMDLFGGEYPLAKFKAAVKDPMMRRDLENLNLPELDNIIKTLDYNERFKKDLKLGIKPQSTVANELEQARIAMEQAKGEKLPLSSLQAPSAIESAMMETYRNPKLNAQNMMKGYAEQVHPQGPEDFYGNLAATKVLRDVEGINTTQGSRMTKLGSQLGAGVGAVMGMATGNQLMTPVLAGLGAAGGASLDLHASNVFRSAARGAQSAQGLQKAIQPLQYASGTGVPLEKLIGTKYESLAQESDPKKQAILHYVLSNRDPEYAQLVGVQK